MFVNQRVGAYSIADAALGKPTHKIVSGLAMAAISSGATDDPAEKQFLPSCSCLHQKGPRPSIHPCLQDAILGEGVLIPHQRSWSW